MITVKRGTSAMKGTKDCGNRHYGLKFKGYTAFSSSKCRAKLACGANRLKVVWRQQDREVYE